jgi:hypothetical protein
MNRMSKHFPVGKIRICVDDAGDRFKKRKFRSKDRPIAKTERLW